MKYTSGKIKQIHVIRFDNNEDFISELKAFAVSKRIKTAFFMFLGALRKGDLVSGPKKPEMPQVPFWSSFDNAWETLGVGSIFPDKDGRPQLHIHSSLGKGNRTKTGCIRKKARVFLVIEAIVMELSGIDAHKSIDPKTGINMLHIKG